MAEVGPPVPPVEFADGPLEAPARRHGRDTGLLFEIAAVLCIAAIPDLYTALAGLITGESYDEPGSSAAIIIFLMVRSITVCVPLAFIMRRSDVPATRFGIVPLRWRFDLPFSALLVIVGWGAAMVVATSLATAAAVAGLDWGMIYGLASADAPAGPPPFPEMIGMILAYTANSAAEELAMRAYLVIRLIDLTGSRWRAVVISSVIFGAYHVYGGLFHVGWAMGLGVVFAAAFIRFRSIWPLVLAHTFANLFSEALSW